MNRRTFLRSAAFTLVGAGLVACAPAAQPPGETAADSDAPAPAEQTNIVFISSIINEGHISVRDKWSQEFMDAHPDVNVEHRTVPGPDYPTVLQTLFAAGTPPDIFFYLQEIFPIISVAERGMNLDLTDFIERDDFDLSDFRPDSVELYRWEGRMYAIPRDYGNQNIYYNVDIFNDAGVPLPPSDWETTEWSFQTFLDTALALTERANGRTTQWGFLVNRAQRPWASWLYCNDGALAHKDERGVATESAMTEDRSVEALQFAQDLIYRHQVAPSPDIESELGGFDLFASGRVAMMIHNPSAVNLFRTIESFEWNVATIPLGAAPRRGTGGGGTGWASSADANHPDVSWEFIKHITTGQAQLDEVSVGATTPSRYAIVTSEQFLDPNLPPANGEAFAQAQEYVVRDPVHVNWPEITQRIYQPKMDLLWGGTEDAITVAQQIKEEADPLFAAA